MKNNIENQNTKPDAHSLLLSAKKHSIFLKIIKFEIRYRFTKPLTLLFLAMLAFQGIWYTKGTYDFYVNDDTLINAAGIFYQNLAAGGMLVMIILAIVTGTAIFKDIEFNTAQTFYSFPLHEKKFFLAKFIAAYLINILLCIAYPLGMVLVPYSGIGTQYGPTPWGQLLHGFIILTMPNVFLLTSISIACIVWFRKMSAGYIGIFLIVISFLIAESTRENSVNEIFNHLLDPFGYGVVVDTINLMPTAQKNTGYLPFTGALFINRLVWIFIAFALFLSAYFRFGFKYFLGSKAKKEKVIQEKESSFAQKIQAKIDAVSLHFSQMEYLKKLFRLSYLEFKNITRPTGFRIILAMLGFMFLAQNLLFRAEYYSSETVDLPLTTIMTMQRLPMGIFIIILLMIWSVELLFKEKTRQVWQIMDTLPVPTWVSVLSKFIASCAVGLILAMVIIGVGVISQLLSGYFNFEWSLYAADLFGAKLGWLTYVLSIALAFFMGSLTGNRFAGHILSIGYVIFNIISHELGILEEHRLAYFFTAGAEDYSEMNGYGIFQLSAFWYALMWLVLGFALLLLSILFWNRGLGKNFTRKFSFKNGQLNLFSKITVALCLVVFLALQSFIYRNVNELSGFKTKTQERAEKADYEKKYKRIEKIAQPKITDLDLKIDLFPVERKAIYQADIQLKNLTNQKIDTLHFNLKDFTQINSIQINGKSLKIIAQDELHRHFTYQLPKTLLPNESLLISFAATTQYIGFTQDDPQGDLAYNGTFLGRELIPIIGYDAERELKENRYRVAAGLQKLTLRMADINDSLAQQQDANAPDATWLKLKIQVSTPENQMAFTAGELKKQWQQKGRNHYLFETVEPTSFNFFIASGDYQVLKDKWETKKKSPISLELFYNPKHHYNLIHFKQSAKEGINFIEQNLGLFSHSQLRLAEIPYYQESSYALANVIAISEKHGWYAVGNTEKELSYVYYVTVKALISQYLNQKLRIAKVQGADMLRVALPDAIALQYIEQKFGKEVLNQILTKKENAYKKGRGNEPNKEPPLLYADGADYLEANKGSIDLFNISKKSGHQKFNQKLNKWIAENEGKFVRYYDFYRGLGEGSGEL